MRDPLGPPPPAPRRPRWVTDVSELDDPWFGRGPWGPLPRSARSRASTVFISLITVLVVASAVWLVLEAITTGR